MEESLEPASALVNLFPGSGASSYQLSFELHDLREAARRYPDHSAHEVWPRLVWERRNQPREKRLDDIVEFLGKWKALRFKGGAEEFRRIYTRWLGQNSKVLKSLHGRPLYILEAEDFQSVLRPSSSFRDNGARRQRSAKPSTFYFPRLYCSGTRSLSGTTTGSARTRTVSCPTNGSNGNYYTASREIMELGSWISSRRNRREPQDTSSP
jgi:hypothetical protein